MVKFQKILLLKTQSSSESNVADSKKVDKVN